MSVFETSKGMQVCTRLTICEIHRRIYDQVVIALQELGDQQTLDLITKDLETAFLMGVKMNQKLVEHKIDDLDKVYPLIKDPNKAAQARYDRIHLVAMAKENDDVLREAG